MFREEAISEYIAFSSFTKKPLDLAEVCYIPSKRFYCVVSDSTVTWSSNRVEYFDKQEIADIYLDLYERYSDVEVLISNGSKVGSSTVVKSRREVLNMPSLSRFRRLRQDVIAMYLEVLDKYAIATAEGVTIEDGSTYSLRELQLMAQSSYGNMLKHAVITTKSLFLEAKVIV